MSVLARTKIHLRYLVIFMLSSSVISSHHIGGSNLMRICGNFEGIFPYNSGIDRVGNAMTPGQ